MQDEGTNKHDSIVNKSQNLCPRKEFLTFLKV